ncbi:MAG: type II secretion system protein M [Magnetococcales bacterium]|nr:type II secretion system protein M [Magnetococcales bacterium]
MVAWISELWLRLTANMAPRERRFLVWGMAALSLLLLLFGAVLPLAEFGQRERDRATLLAEQLAWMESKAAEVAVARSQGGAVGQMPAGTSLATLADRTVRDQGLGDALKRVEPEGTDKVRLWLEGASFDRLAAWLDRLMQEFGVEVYQSQVEGEETPGRVKARVVLRQAGGA